MKARFGGCKASVKHLASHTQPKTRGASFAEGRCPQRLSLPPQRATWRGSVDQSRRGGRVRWVGASSARPKSNRHLREEGRGVNRLVRPRAMVETSGRIIIRSNPSSPLGFRMPRGNGKRWTPEAKVRLRDMTSPGGPQLILAQRQRVAGSRGGARGARGEPTLKEECHATLMQHNYSNVK